MIDPNDSEREIADVAHLLGDPTREKPADRVAATPQSTGSYELDDVELPDRPAGFAQQGFDEIGDRPKVRGERGSQYASPEKRGHVWTRAAEWWPALVRVGLTLMIAIYLTVKAIEDFSIPTTLLVAFCGLIAVIVMSYPLIITLERPVRFTPEQALKDYFAALSNVFPHHRRMWLLLSSQGQSTLDFGSLNAFRAYWQAIVFKYAGNKYVSPLRFEVTEFKTEQGGGQTDDVEVRYQVVITRLGSSPIATIPMEMTLSRGSDRMWYLNEGRLLTSGKPGAT